MNNQIDIRNINEEEFYELTTAKERIKFLLRYAILAPSTHNSQPWLFKISDDFCQIYINEKLKLKQADPQERDLYISIGCCIENIAIAAAYFNVHLKINYHEKNRRYLAADIRFHGLMQSKEEERLQDLFFSIKKRITKRGVFLNKKIPNLVLRELENNNRFKKEGIELKLITDKKRIIQLATSTKKGIILAYKSNKFRWEMSKWFNHNLSKRKMGIHGYSIRLPTVISFLFPLVVRYFDVGKVVSFLNYKSIKSSTLACVITSEQNDCVTWIKIGRLAERSMLLLTSNNISPSIYLAAIEMGRLYKEVETILGTRDRPQFLFCAGYMNLKDKFSPRHSLEDKILTESNV